MTIQFAATLTDAEITAAVTGWFATPASAQLRSHDEKLGLTTPATVGEWLAGNGRAQEDYMLYRLLLVEDPAGTVAAAVQTAFGATCLVEDPDGIALYGYPVDEDGEPIEIAAYGLMPHIRVSLDSEEDGYVPLPPVVPSPAFVAAVGTTLPDGPGALQAAAEALRAELTRVLVHTRDGVAALDGAGAPAAG